MTNLVVEHQVLKSSKFYFEWENEERKIKTVGIMVVEKLKTVFNSSIRYSNLKQVLEYNSSW